MSLVINDKDNLTPKTLAFVSRTASAVSYVDAATTKPVKSRLNYVVAKEKLQGDLQQVSGKVNFPLDATDYYDGSLPVGKKPGSMSVKIMVIVPEGVKPEKVQAMYASAVTALVTVGGNTPYLYDVVVGGILPNN